MIALVKTMAPFNQPEKTKKLYQPTITYKADDGDGMRNPYTKQFLQNILTTHFHSVSSIQGQTT